MLQGKGKEISAQHLSETHRWQQPRWAPWRWFWCTHLWWSLRTGRCWTQGSDSWSWHQWDFWLGGMGLQGTLARAWAHTHSSRFLWSWNLVQSPASKVVRQSPLYSLLLVAPAQPELLHVAQTEKKAAPSQCKSSGHEGHCEKLHGSARTSSPGRYLQWIDWHCHSGENAIWPLEHTHTDIFLYWGLNCSPLHHPFLGCQIHWTSQWTSWWASGLQLLPQGLPSTPWQVPKLGCPEKFWAKSAVSHHCQMTSDDSAKTSWSCANAQELALATPTSAISHELLHEVLPKVIHHQLEFKKRQLKITQ